MKRKTLAFGAAIAIAVLGGGGVAQRVVAQQKVALNDMAADSAQWAMPGQNYANLRDSDLDEIKTDNVANLKAAWTMSTGATRGHEGQPLVIGDTMYFESAYPNHVYAIDLADYHIKWQFTPKEDPFATSVACCDLVNRGVAYGDGKIIVDALDGQVIALNAATGKPIWTIKNSNPELGQTLTAAPLVVNDKVVIGVSGGEYGVRGYLTTYSLATGKRAWRAYSAGPDSDTLIPANFNGPKNAGVSTWQGDAWKVGRWHDLGLVFVRSQTQSHLLRHRQPWNVESYPAARRQQVVDDDLRARCRYRRGEMGVSNDSARCVGLRRHQRDDSRRSQHERRNDSVTRALRPQTALRTNSTAATDTCCWPRSSTATSIGRRALTCRPAGRSSIQNTAPRPA